MEGVSVQKAAVTSHMISLVSPGPSLMIAPQVRADYVIDDILICDLFTVASHVWIISLLICSRPRMGGGGGGKLHLFS